MPWISSLRFWSTETEARKKTLQTEKPRLFDCERMMGNPEVIVSVALVPRNGIAFSDFADSRIIGKTKTMRLYVEF